MQGRLLIFIFILLSHSALAQIEASIKKHNFGEVERTTDRVVDIQFTNNGDDGAFVLRTKSENYYSTLWSHRQVATDSTITLRVKFNPRNKGAYNDDLEIYFSTMQEPIKIKLRAEVNYVDRGDNPACPSFRERPDNCCEDDAFMVKVIDQKTRKPIKNARFRLIEQGVLQRDVRTDREGVYTEPVPVGYYFMVASAEGYLSTDSTSYINRRNNYFELELEKEEKEEELELEEELEEEWTVESEETIVIRIERPIEPEPEPEPAVVEPVEEEPILVTSADLPEDQYRPNSIVFLVDVSQSMNQSGKLDLLKASMLEMIGILRPIDQVALISYASKTEVVFDMTSADRKGEMESAIKALEAGGMTSGAKGFRDAYELVNEYFIEGGNNEVIVTTDGAFTKRDSPQILKMADKNRKKDVKTTVVGIRSKSYAIETLEKVAEEGQGSFILIEDYDVALKSLVDEIKKQSLRRQ